MAVVDAGIAMHRAGREAVREPSTEVHGQLLRQVAVRVGNCRSRWRRVAGAPGTLRRGQR